MQIASFSWFDVKILTPFCWCALFLRRSVQRVHRLFIVLINRIVSMTCQPFLHYHVKIIFIALGKMYKKFLIVRQVRWKLKTFLRSVTSFGYDMIDHFGSPCSTKALFTLQVLSSISDFLLLRSDLHMPTVQIRNYEWPVSNSNENPPVLWNSTHGLIDVFQHESTLSTKTYFWDYLLTKCIHNECMHSFCSEEQ